ncbi:MAG TPA: choice-of-anchor tandem repeat GloVer-containing protein [Rhizomicrobium sp.]
MAGRNAYVFMVDPGTGAETVLYSFSGGKDGATPTAGLLYQNGTFYGVTSAGGTSGVGAVFAFDPATKKEKVLHSFKGFADGDAPFGGLLYHGGQLFGTTEYGGTNGSGTVYSVDPATRAERVIYIFRGGKDGDQPMSNLIYRGGPPLRHHAQRRPRHLRGSYG